MKLVYIKSFDIKMHKNYDRFCCSRSILVYYFTHNGITKDGLGCCHLTKEILRLVFSKLYVNKEHPLHNIWTIPLILFCFLIYILGGGVKIIKKILFIYVYDIIKSLINSSATATIIPNNNCGKKEYKIHK